MAGRNLWDAHGIYAPSVAVMRSLRFKAKAGLISAIFLAPLLLTANAWHQDLQRDLRTLDQDGNATQAIRKSESAIADAVRLSLTASARHTDIRVPDQALIASATALRTQMDKLLASASTEDRPATDSLLVKRTIDLIDAYLRAPLQADVTPLLTEFHRLVGSLGSLDSPSISKEVLLYATLTDVRVRLALSSTAATQAYRLSTPAESMKALSTIAQTRAMLDVLGRMIESVRSDAPSETQGKNALVEARSLALDFLRLLESALMGPAELRAAKLREAFQMGTQAQRQMQDIALLGLEQQEVKIRGQYESLQGERTRILVLSLLSLMLAMYAFAGFHRANRGGFDLVRQHLKRLSQGDFSHAPSSPLGNDEVSAVIGDLAGLYSRLDMMARQIQEASREIQLVSTSLEGGIPQAESQDSHAQQVAASIEDQAAYIARMAADVRDQLERLDVQQGLTTRMASTTQFAHSTLDPRGAHPERHRRGATASAPSAMDGLSAGKLRTASERMRSIAQEIEGLAHQTNILAVNATEEANRAGSAGRGFVIVANEIRRMSDRCAKASDEINSLVKETARIVEAFSQTH